jgi:hypothetical protein
LKNRLTMPRQTRRWSTDEQPEGILEPELQSVVDELYYS